MFNIRIVNADDSDYSLFQFYEFNTLYGRSSAQDIVILITRDRPSDNERAVAEVEMLKRKMIRVIPVGVGPYPRYFKTTLKYIASFAHDIVVSKYNELVEKTTDVLDKICLPFTMPKSK